jgi:hypothetical protein
MQSQSTLDDENDDVIGSPMSLSSQSSASTTSRKHKRSHIEYWEEQLKRANIDASIKRRCPCGDAQNRIMSCCEGFSYGDVAGIRHKRASMDPCMEYKLRETELMDAFKFSSVEVPRVKVWNANGSSKLLCIEAYITIVGLPRSSTWRKWSRIKTSSALNPVGRPIRILSNEGYTARGDINTLAKEYCLQWLINWSELIADENPVGDKYLKTIDLVTPAEVYEEYKVDFNTTFLSVHARPLGIDSFRRVWRWWIKEHKIHIREKKNITTKCEGQCDFFSVHASKVWNFFYVI